MTAITHQPLTVTLGSAGVTPEDVLAVARHDAKVTISPDALETVAKVRAHIDDLAAQKLERLLTNDPGMGVIRHADAGYDRAVEVAKERGVRIPMNETR